VGSIFSYHPPSPCRSIRARTDRSSGVRPLSAGRGWSGGSPGGSWSGARVGSPSGPSAGRRNWQTTPTCGSYRLGPERGSRRRVCGVIPDSTPNDPRLPVPGTVLTRPYKGGVLQMPVLANGFAYAGDKYGSLSAVAKAATGSHCNGFAFFGLAGKGGQAMTRNGMLAHPPASSRYLITGYGRLDQSSRLGHEGRACRGAPPAATTPFARSIPVMGSTPFRPTPTQFIGRGRCW